MSQSKQHNGERSNSIEKLFSRHNSWKNTRRHTALKLIRFS